MKVLLFGATGMLGQGVLRACLLAADVEQVLTVGRTGTGQQNAKLQELVQADLFNLAPAGPRLAGFDACFFCLGVSAAGLSEAEYSRQTFDLTLAVATLLAELNPGLTFIYVSGAGTDSSEQGRTMWARVKGRTENALLRLPFKAACMLRPGAIQPLHGARSKTALYRHIYTATRPLLPLLRRWFPNTLLTTDVMAQAMLNLVRQGAGRGVLEAADINRIGAAA